MAGITAVSKRVCSSTRLNSSITKLLALAMVFGLNLPVACGQSATPDYVPGEIIVKLKGSSKTLKSQAFIGKSVFGRFSVSL
jgi:hypothetical protein